MQVTVEHELLKVFSSPHLNLSNKPAGSLQFSHGLFPDSYIACNQVVFKDSKTKSHSNVNQLGYEYPIIQFLKVYSFRFT